MVRNIQLKKLYTIYFWCWEVDIGANAFLSVFCLSPRTFDHNPIQSCLSTTNVSRPRPVTLYLYDFICFIHYMENLTNVCYALFTTQITIRTALLVLFTCHCFMKFMVFTIMVMVTNNTLVHTKFNLFNFTLSITILCFDFIC